MISRTPYRLGVLFLVVAAASIAVASESPDLARASRRVVPPFVATSLLHPLPGAGAASSGKTETTFEVIHKKRFQPDSKGVLRIADEEILFDAQNEKHSRRWAYRDIRFLDRVGPAEIILHTYENVRLTLGRDKRYRFVLTAGELTVDQFNHVSAKVGKPVANRSFVSPENPEYEIPVKHRHQFGGCQGRLLFTESRIFFQSDAVKKGPEQPPARERPHSREWILARDVDSVWSADAYHLELHVYDGEQRRTNRTRIFRFDLKQKLDQDFLRNLKLRLYHLNTSR